jgi:hypothetical protein
MTVTSWNRKTEGKADGKNNELRRQGVDKEKDKINGYNKLAM